MNHRPDAHSLGAARVAELDQQSSQKVSTLWQRRCFSHEELNRYERLGWIGSRSSTKVVLRLGEDLSVCYDCCQCSRDTRAWCVTRHHEDLMTDSEMVDGLSVWLAISEIWQRSLDSRAHPFHISVHSEDFPNWTLGTEKKSVVKLRRVSRNVSNFRKKSSWVGADTSPPSTYWPCGQIWWTGPPRALEASFGASGHAMDEDVGGDVGPEFETAYEVVGKRYRKWWKAGVVLGDLQISKVVDEKKHTHHIFLQVDGAKILEVTSVMLKWSMILIWWDDIIEICCCRCFILYSCLSIFCQGSHFGGHQFQGFSFHSPSFRVGEIWWNTICLILGVNIRSKGFPIQGGMTIANTRSLDPVYYMHLYRLIHPDLVYVHFFGCLISWWKLAQVSSRSGQSCLSEEFFVDLLKCHSWRTGLLKQYMNKNIEQQNPVANDSDVFFNELANHKEFAMNFWHLLLLRDATKFQRICNLASGHQVSTSLGWLFNTTLT